MNSVLTINKFMIKMENFSYGDTKDFLHDGMPAISDLSRSSTVAPDVSGESNNSYPPYNTNQQQFVQSSMGMIPSNEEFPGPYNFDIILLNTSTKYNWVVSSFYLGLIYFKFVFCFSL